jgi:outer membrane protein, heavy metal efflux system
MKFNSAYSFIFFSLLATGFLTADAQRVIPESEVIELALKNSGAFQSSALQVQQNKYLQKTGFNLPNPDVIAESPTGEFYAVGILQSVEFPSVYFKQNQLRKQITKLSEKQKELTSQDVRIAIRTLYLNLQFAQAVYDQLKVRDSLYTLISNSAQRQFDAGTIDYLARTFARSQAGEIHNRFIEARYELDAIKNQIKIYTGIPDDFKARALTRLNFEMVDVLDTAAISSNPTVQYYQQLRNVNRKTLSVERNKALPGLVFGYLNQGPRDTDTYYRFRVGFTVPLWFWQYSGNIKAAKTGVQIAEQDSRAQTQSISAQMLQAVTDFRKYNESLVYYETQGMSQSDEIIETARRFFASGQNDYVAYLRNITEAYNIKARYLETQRNFNQSVIMINYLTGKL